MTARAPDWCVVVDGPLDDDLGPWVDVLRARRIPVRTWEADGRQHVAVPVAARAMVEELLREFRRGALRPPPPAPSLLAIAAARLVRTPITAALLLVMALAWPATWAPSGRWFDLWTFIPAAFAVGADTALQAWGATLADGQWWRLWTPMLLHFGPFHLLLNALWLYEFGRRIEGVDGARRLLVLVVITGLVANMAEFLWSLSGRFGGMSGVVNGLFGYLAVAGRRDPALRLPPGLVGVMLLLLLFETTGVLTVVDLHLAHGAHWGGLLAGALLGGLRGARMPPRPPAGPVGR